MVMLLTMMMMVMMPVVMAGVIKAMATIVLW